MLFEGAVVAIIKEHGGDYGLQKIFGTMGAVVFGPLSGALIDLEQKKTNYQDNPGTKLSLYKSNEMMMAALKGDCSGLMERKKAFQMSSQWFKSGCCGLLPCKDIQFLIVW